MPNAKLPRLDRPAIRAAATDAVKAELAAIPNRLDRLEAAAKIADTAQADADKVRPKRDAAALSLATHDGLRALNTVIGVNRTRWYEIRTAHDTSTVKHSPTAANRLPDLAQRVAVAEERARAARAIRDDIVADLVDEGWQRPQIAERIGRNPSRISHIKRAHATEVAG
jgi:hypothetical protein